MVFDPSSIGKKKCYENNQFKDFEKKQNLRKNQAKPRKTFPNTRASTP